MKNKEGGEVLLRRYNRVLNDRIYAFGDWGACRRPYWKVSMRDKYSTSFVMKTKSKNREESGMFLIETFYIVLNSSICEYYF